MFFYAVAKGQTIGIFNTWKECQNSINGFSGAKFKKFPTKIEAEEYIKNINTQELPDSVNIKCKQSSPDTIFVNIYTDGSLVRKNGNCYAGYGIYIPSKDIEKSYILEGKKTNNRGELLAIINGIEMFDENGNIGVHVYTDSDYSIKIFGDTGEKYMLKNYKKSKTEEYPNTDLVKKAVSLREKYMIKFTHINSHTGNLDEHSLGNDKADKLAVKGSVTDYVNSIDNLGNCILSFGKNKDKKLSKIDKDYLIWVSRDPKFEELCVKKEDLRLEKELVKKYLEQKLK